jgi:hypothetical protein
VVAVIVNSAMRAVELLSGRGVSILSADEVVADADAPEIPVGIGAAVGAQRRHPRSAHTGRSVADGGRSVKAASRAAAWRGAPDAAGEPVLWLVLPSCYPLT